MTIAQFDAFDLAGKKELLYSCCASHAWVTEMLTVFPVEDLIDLLEYAEEKWYDCNPAEWQEAFFNQPPASTLKATAQKYGVNIEAASFDVNQNGMAYPGLKEALTEYQENFGYPCIAFTVGKTGEDLFDMIQNRLLNSSHEELLVSAAEQDKITKWRLKKILG